MSARLTVMERARLRFAEMRVGAESLEIAAVSVAVRDRDAVLADKLDDIGNSLRDARVALTEIVRAAAL